VERHGLVDRVLSRYAPISVLAANGPLCHIWWRNVHRGLKGSSNCWAIGENINSSGTDPLIEKWNGTSWSVTAS